MPDLQFQMKVGESVADLPAGARLSGPTIVTDDHSTVVVEPGWEAELLSGGELLLTDRGEAAISSTSATISGTSEKFP